MPQMNSGSRNIMPGARILWIVTMNEAVRIDENRDEDPDDDQATFEFENALLYGVRRPAGVHAAVTPGPQREDPRSCTRTSSSRFSRGTRVLGPDHQAPAEVASTRGCGDQKKHT